MVDLATQLIKRQSGAYDPADLEDRYETRLRAMIDAKVQGGGLMSETDAPPASESNVIDLMAALKKSLMGAPQAEPEKPKRTTSKKEPERRQGGLKLPIAGGKSKAVEDVPAKGPPRPAEPVAQPVKGRRKAS